MPRPATTTPTTAQSVGALLKSACGIMRKDIVAEVTRLRAEARRLRKSAGADLLRAIASFKRKLWGATLRNETD
jgi:hypothetical protein